MKRPTYLKIDFPVPHKVPSRSPVKGYFNRLASKTLDVGFGKERQRKVFRYKIVSAGFFEGLGWPYGTGNKTFRVELELISDPS
jgi:hypothetical protein